MTQHQDNDPERPRAIRTEDIVNEVGPGPAERRRGRRYAGPPPATPVDITWGSAFKIAVAIGVVALVCTVCYAVLTT